MIGLGLRRIRIKHTLPKQEPTIQAAANTSLHKTISYKPVRKIPEKFRKDTFMPPKPERDISGGRNAELFSPGRDLIYVDDKRVYWESDHDKNDTECDHSMHKAMEEPLRLLIELVCQKNGTLEVQDTYRASGIHNKRSLHKEGRAIDITCDELGLEKLACLAWAAGFDWVYYEASSRGGAHVHCSVKTDHIQPKQISNHG